ncbi:MAG: hypothetical protein RL664_532 [Bacteroidota bacterium]|jgi:UDP-N-acetylmuramyl pentapeptide phosphotransferase/UDP-N-acetylglucosamine-1-phosphate transferase
MVLVAMPPLIKVAKMKHLVDEPGEERKLHRRSVPTLGGVLIFAATIISYCLWFPSRGSWELGANYNPLQALNEFKYILASMFVLFFIGLKDDIVGIDPIKKLIVHLFVGIILVVLADIRLTEFWGLFEVDKLPYWLSVLLSIFIYVVIVNAFNLIDGVDGLAGGIGLIGSVTFTIWFFHTGDMPLALLAVGLAGSLLGFLIFNFQPARIFMGDSGSLIIGICMYVLAMKLIEFPPSKLSVAMQIVSKPIFAMSVLAYPLIDTLRVFSVRIVNGKSPFTADKNHIHHRLLSLGLKHYQVSIVLYFYTLIVIGSTFLMPPQTPNISFLVIGSGSVLLAYLPFLIPLKGQEK